MGLGECTHFTSHRGDDLLGSLCTGTINRRYGAEDRSRPHIDAACRQSDQSTRRKSSAVHEGINGHTRIGNRVGDALRRIDASTGCIDIEDDDTYSGTLGLTDGTFDERGEPHLHHAGHGNPEYQWGVLCKGTRRPAHESPDQYGGGGQISPLHGTPLLGSLIVSNHHKVRPEPGSTSSLIPSRVAPRAHTLGRTAQSSVY